MANPGGRADDKKLMRVIERAFPGDEAPHQLSVGIVSLVELCDLAMPDPRAIRQRLDEAKFESRPQEQSDQMGALLALDQKVFSFPVRKLKHALFVRDRYDELVRLMLSEGDSDQGKVVFCTSIFGGAMEADAVKAVVHVSKRQPITGATARNAGGDTLRRVFWDVEGDSGIRGLMITGPENVEAIDQPRAITAFNFVKAK